MGSERGSMEGKATSRSELPFQNISSSSTLSELVEDERSGAPVPISDGSSRKRRVGKWFARAFGGGSSDRKSKNLSCKSGEISRFPGSARTSCSRDPSISSSSKISKIGSRGFGAHSRKPSLYSDMTAAAGRGRPPDSLIALFKMEGTESQK